MLSPDPVFLLVGQWFFFFSHSNLEWWKIGLFGVTSGILLVIVFLYNLFVYYLLFLIRFKQTKSIFLIKLEQMHWIWRLIIGCFMMALVLIVAKFG
ncbi:hypothetical protein CPG37_09315 [Malaciobacter canalis]|uniref:Copper resistance protein D domain-containing protein n=1 Tax=Malaciobacter canalis TaxID=1912871 RepID=A0ABX4LNK1_9BACT|nr:hypothetical protein CPG37_09315 [Malaciobacter canalis]QEE33592.1 hypothetical protein ACAN_2141 [Malaciobacter canalis]